MKCWARGVPWAVCVCLKMLLLPISWKNVYFLGRNSMSRISVFGKNVPNVKTHTPNAKAIWMCKNSTNTWGIGKEVQDRKYLILIPHCLCFNFLSFLFSLSRSSFPTQCVYFPLPERTAGKIMNYGSLGYRRGFPSKLQSSQPSKFIS